MTGPLTTVTIIVQDTPVFSQGIGENWVFDETPVSTICHVLFEG